MGRRHGSSAARFNADLRALFGAQAMSSVGDSLLLIAVSVFVYQLTGSAAQVAVLYAVMILPATLGMVIGPLLNRLPLRATLIVCDLVRAAILALVPILAREGVSVLYLALVVVSVLGTVFASARMTLMRDAAAGIPLTRVNGFDSTTMIVGQLVGLIAGGGLITVDYRWAFWIDALTFVISAVFLARLTVGRQAAQTGAEPIRFGASLAHGYAYVVKRPVLAYNIFGNTLFNFGVGVFNAMLVVFCFRQLQAGSLGYTALEVSQLVGVTAGGAYLAYLADSRQPGRTMFAGNLATGLLVVVLGLVDQLAVAVVLAVAIGVANVIGSSISRTMLMEDSSPEQRSNVMSIRMALGRPVNTVGALVGGIMIERTGSAAPTMVAAGAAITLFAVLSLAVPSVIRYSSPAAEQEGVHA